MNTVHDMSSEASVDGDIPRPVFSRFYARICPRLEDEGLAELRAELLAGLTGDVVEIGAGNGQNFRHYPAGVRSVVAVEPEPHLRGLAVRAARAAALPVSVRAGRAESLPLPEASVDAAVLCLVMCSLPDRVAALAELRRVLRPGGVVRFLEHTRADTAGLALVQRIADATLWPWFTGGCHTARDPLAALRDAGFTVTRVRRLRFPAGRAAVQPTRARRSTGRKETVIDETSAGGDGHGTPSTMRRPLAPSAATSTRAATISPGPCDRDLPATTVVATGWLIPGR